MLTILAVASALLSPTLPMRPDTPPPLPIPIERLSDLKSQAEIVAASRLADGSPAPAGLELPQLANRSEVMKYMIEHYPLSLRDRYDFGMPWAWVFVDEHGAAAEAHIVKSSGRAEFDSLAIAALRIARFAPALANGAPLGVWVPLPIQIAYSDLADKSPREPPRGGEQPHFTPYTTRPELLNRTEVAAELIRKYPPALRAAGAGGEVSLFLFVDETGQTLRAQVRKSSGNDELDNAALEVARVMRWSPALNRDQKVAVWIAVPVVFRTRDGQ